LLLVAQKTPAGFLGNEAILVATESQLSGFEKSSLLTRLRPPTSGLSVSPKIKVLPAEL
jgi:hypothetical protein